MLNAQGVLAEFIDDGTLDTVVLVWLDYDTAGATEGTTDSEVMRYDSEYRFGFSSNTEFLSVVIDDFLEGRAYDT